VTTDFVAAIRFDVDRLSAATTPAIRGVRRRYSKTLARESADLIVEIADRLFADDSWAGRQIACELVVQRRDVVRRLTGPMVEAWSKAFSDWGSIDLFGVTVAGVAWREGRVSDSRVARWARSKNRWRRRLALVATVPLNSRARGGDGDTARTLSVCRMLVDDRDEMVVKALSWALRELTKRDPKSVKRFARQFDARLAARVRREVRNKLETGRKEIRR
jgi:3-methyladenine DNA glycosylase AlkD